MSYVQVELIVEHGGDGRTEEEARALVEKIRAFARRLGLPPPYVEDYDETPKP